MNVTPWTLEKICYSNIANYIIAYNYFTGVMDKIGIFNSDEIMFALYKNGLPAQFCIKVFEEIRLQVKIKKKPFFISNLRIRLFEVEGNQHPVFFSMLGYKRFAIELEKSRVVRTLKKISEEKNKKLLDEFFIFKMKPPFNYETEYCYLLF